MGAQADAGLSARASACEPTTIAPATVADLDAIDAIETHSHAAPWPRATWEAELARADARIDLARDDRGRVVGYCNWRLVLDEVHVHAIAVHVDHRRAGVGAQLLAHALARGASHGARTASLEVRGGNAPAIAMYRRAGFAIVHTRRGYYANGEDALIMIATLAIT